jgi:gluconolactonase
MVKPNGIAFSPDEQRLYVADTGASHDPNCPRVIRVYDVVDGRSLANGRDFCHIDPGMADGFRFDRNGYLYTSSADSIQVYTEDGTRIGKIMVPEKIANCAFGGPQKNRLFITATTSLYVIDLNTRGI